MANIYASIDLYNKFSDLRWPINRNILYFTYGLTDYQTDSTTYTHMYSIETATWLQEVTSTVGDIFYDNTYGLFFLSNLYSDVNRSTRWFTLNDMVTNVYTASSSISRLSPTNNQVTVYRVSDSAVVPAISIVDPHGNITRYLVRPDYNPTPDCNWWDEENLEMYGFSLTRPIPLQGFCGSFADDSMTLLTSDLAGDRIFKDILLRHQSITPFNGELVTGGNIKISIPPSELGDYGYMDDVRDFDMSYVETGYVGKPTVFYSSTLTEKVGAWGTIPMTQSIRAYLRSAAYQGNNMNVSASSTNHLYGQGESSFLPAESGKTYTLTGAYKNNDTSVSIEGCSLSIVSNTVKLVWGSTAAQVCYVTIDVN